MTDDVKQEFDAARIKHLHFKSRLRSYLFGSGTAEAPIRDPHQCSFGQWIHTYVLPRFGHLPESRQLDRLHDDIHRVANRLMDLYQQGRADDAISGLPEVNRLADQITALLRTLEQAARPGA